MSILKKLVATGLTASILMTSLSCSFSLNAAGENAVKNVAVSNCVAENPKNEKDSAKTEPKKETISKEDEKKLAKVKDFIAQNAKYLPKSKLKSIKKQLGNLSKKEISSLENLEFRDPLIVTIVSIFLGELGIDRMIIGHYGKGILKLLTAGGFGIWWLIDIFKISSVTKNENYKMLKDTI